MDEEEEKEFPKWLLISLVVLAILSVILAPNVAYGIGQALGGSVIIYVAYGVGRKTAAKTSIGDWFSEANYRTIAAFSLLISFFTATTNAYAGYLMGWILCIIVYMPVKMAIRLVRNITN